MDGIGDGARLPAMVKSERIAAVLRDRLVRGDYALRAFPSERDLAAELGVSYLTARKAVIQLILEGVLERAGRGRAKPSPDVGSGRPTLAMLAPAYPSRCIHRFQELLSAAAARHRYACQSLRFIHWDEPVVAEVLRHSRGVLMVMPPGEVPAAMVAMLRESRARVAVVGQDLSRHGLPAIDHLPAMGMRLALDHFAARGRRQVAVLNTQPHDHAIHARLAEAQVWARAHPDVRMTIHDHAVAPFDDALPAARQAARRLLSGRQGPDAVLGVTLMAAMGTLRAAADLGLADAARPAVAAMDGEDLADELVPAITTVDGTGHDAAIADTVRWMMGGAWQGPLIRPCPPRLTVRESSG